MKIIKATPIDATMSINTLDPRINDLRVMVDLENLKDAVRLHYEKTLDDKENYSVYIRFKTMSPSSYLISGNEYRSIKEFLDNPKLYIEPFIAAKEKLPFRHIVNAIMELELS